VKYLEKHPVFSYPKDYWFDTDEVRTRKTESLQNHRSSVSILGSTILNIITQCHFLI